MSNTGRNKKLASFNCDTELWERFITRCQEQRTTATAVLTKFISLYLDGELDNLDTHLGKTQKTFSDAEWEQIKEWVDEYLDNRNKDLQAQVMALSQKMEDLHRVVEIPAPQNTSSQTLKSKPSKEPEVWFIQQRAKHLGLTVSANQVIHVELQASEYYKARHGKVPQKQLFKNTQASAYPKNDVDILDTAIKEVLARQS